MLFSHPKINCQIQKDKPTFQNIQCLMLVEVPDPRGSEIDRCPAQSEKIGLPESTTLFEDRVFQHESRSQTV